MFREAYRKRHCIVPVEGFFEWQATKGGKQPYAIAMKNGAPCGYSEPMKMWPISKRMNSPRNDDEGLLAEIDIAAAS